VPNRGAADQPTRPSGDWLRAGMTPALVVCCDASRIESSSVSLSSAPSFQPTQHRGWTSERVQTRKPPPCCARHVCEACVVGSLGRGFECMRPSKGPTSHASVAVADHVSERDCASVSIITCGSVFGGAVPPCVCWPWPCLAGCAPSRFRPSPADPCFCSRCHHTSHAAAARFALPFSKFRPSPPAPAPAPASHRAMTIPAPKTPAPLPST
jgi:hypothetical protein